MRLRRLILCLLLLLLSPAPPAAAQQTLTVFAAASLKNALDDVNAKFFDSTGIRVVVSYAATSALVKQIEQGAPADIFISADPPWMGYATEHNLIRADTRVALLGNRLVLIAPRDSKAGRVNIDRNLDLLALAGDGRIAVANVATVPAGRYAKAALQSLGLWTKAEAKLAMAENVRAALAFVSRGETAVGIVYATDAQADPGVKVIGEFPDGSYPGITYPVAATRTATLPLAQRYLAFLRSSPAKTVFERHGFSYLIRPTS